MLKVEPIAVYRIARYPRGRYYSKPIPLPLLLAKKGIVPAALMLILESCDGTGTTGPPPIEPEFITEQEARQAINIIFAGNGISLDEDVPIRFDLGGNDSTDLVIDGFNSDLRVGYEYITGRDDTSFTPQVIEALDEAAEGAGPYIKPAFRAYEYELEELQETMRAFIDTLKAHGVI